MSNPNYPEGVSEKDIDRIGEPMMAENQNVVHIPLWTQHNLIPLCGTLDETNTYSGGDDNSICLLATCLECLQEYLTNKCTMCYGNGKLKDAYEKWKCPSCDADLFIKNRDKEQYQ